MVGYSERPTAVEQVLYQTIVVRRELGGKAKFFFNQSVYILTLICVPELWLVTTRIRSRIQVEEVRFLCRVAGLSLRDKVRSTDIQRELTAPLHHCTAA